ncbi:MAG: hypothetical protein ACRYHQ_07645 [Janthinobacterium lividum]
MARRNTSLALAPDPVTPRDVLRQRHAEWGVAHQAVQAAEALIERARADVEAATAKVEAGEDAETRIRAHKVQALRSGGSTTDALPEILAVARNVHRDAKDQLGDARAVVATVQADLEEARAEYQRVGQRVELAAQDVVRAEDAARIATELQAARETVDRLANALDGLMSIRVRQNFVGYNPGLIGTPFEMHQGPMVFPADVLAALNPEPTGEIMGTRERRYAKWTAYFRALQQDPETAAPV